jgi:hypothetical protein
MRLPPGEAKRRFQLAVRRVVEEGGYPGPLAITRMRARLFDEGLRQRNTLGVVEMGWRSEILLDLGWEPTHRMWNDTQKWAWKKAGAPERPNRPRFDLGLKL